MAAAVPTASLRRESSPSRGFTPKFIESLRPREAAYEIADPRKPGLRLRMLPSGVRVFRWYVRSLGRVVTLGPWTFSEAPAHVTLKQAHDWLDRLKAARAAGEAQLDQVLAELRAALRPVRPAHEEPSSPDRRLFRSVAEEFYADDILRNRKHPLAVRDVLDRDLLPPLGNRPLEELTTLEVRDAVKAVVARGAPIHAGKVLAVAKQCLSWAQANGFTDRNPAAPLKARHLGIVPKLSQRCLDDPHRRYPVSEIKLLWDALGESTSPPRPTARADYRAPERAQNFNQRRAGPAPATRLALKLLLLTGVRTGELLKARWADVDFDGATWTIPVANRKLTKKAAELARPLVVPLCGMALAVLRDLQGLAGKSPWVMASGESSDGRYTDRSLSAAMRAMLEGKPPLLTLPGGPISPHDLRRSMRTHLGQLRVPFHVIELCLGHSLGRIVQTYDVSDHLEERREALARWEAHLSRLLTGKGAAVVPLQAAGARA